MKVRKQESQDLLTALQQRGLDQTDTILWKKKGWLHIKLLSSDRVFSYHRIDQVKLIDGTFSPEVNYQVTQGDSTQSIPTWVEVLQQFHLWLDQMT